MFMQSLGLSQISVQALQITHQPSARIADERLNLQDRMLYVRRLQCLRFKQRQEYETAVAPAAAAVRRGMTLLGLFFRAKT